MSSPTRLATLSRKTAETDISLSIQLDGGGKTDIQTGVGFFDHMLTLFGKHSLTDLTVRCDGDTHIDYHHTVEDTGIVLGSAIRQALGDKKGIVRYGWCYLPMDETLTRVVVDLSGRAFLEFRGPQNVPNIGNFNFSLVEEFCRAFAHNLAANVHVEILYGRDAHHMAESVFKGLARALDAAMKVDPRVTGVPSTKETL
jgi:imidazoleglycerol-phosphate dehydratase